MSEAKQLLMEVSLAAQKQSFSEVEAFDTFRGPQGPKGDPGSIDNLVINGKEAVPVDGKNTISLTPSDVGALPSGGTAKDSSKLGGKAPEYYLQPRNLLDNSNFRNPVNQRGAGGTYGAWGGYTVDRWATYADGATVNLTTQGLSLYKSIYQPIGADTMLRYNGKHLTYAVKIDGVVYVVSGLFEQTGAWHMIQRIDTPYGYISFEAQNDNSLFCVISNNISAATIEWAALYEGEYTADNLPPYVPKGYAAELAECQRYYENSWNGVAKTEPCQHIGAAFSNEKFDSPIYFIQKKRTKPTMNYLPSGGRDAVKAYINLDYRDVSVETHYRIGLKGVVARVTPVNQTLTNGLTYQFHAHWEACADL